MANISVQRSSANTQPKVTREAEPMRMIQELLKWDPFQQMLPAWTGPEWPTTTFSPAFEVKETQNAYLFKADVPGMREQDVLVTVTGNRLTIAGKREEEKADRGDTYYTCERTYGSFSRSFTLPEGADLGHVQADLQAGVLTLAVPKLPEVQAKKIEVKSAEKSTKV